MAEGLENDFSTISDVYFDLAICSNLLTVGAAASSWLCFVPSFKNSDQSPGDLTPLIGGEELCQHRNFVNDFLLFRRNIVTLSMVFLQS